MKFECIFAMFTPRTITYISIASERFLCSEIGGSISSQIYGLSHFIGASDALVLGVVLGGTEGGSLSCTQNSNTFTIMPRTKSICVRGNNSTPIATLFHETETNLVSVHEGQVVTTSLQVAEVFNKPHNDVLKSIRALDCSRELREGNFSRTFYYVDMPNNARRKEPMYYIGRDGFVFLVMGFTGKIAAKFKEAYIRQFNEMEEMLRKSKETQYANRLLDAQVERFSRDLKAIVRRRQMDGHRYYGPAGELRTGFFYDKSADFESKLETVFSQVKNAYLDGFYFAEDMQEYRRQLDAIGGSVREFIENIHGKVDIY